MATKRKYDGELDLSLSKRKRFRIDGDDSRVLELNTSDLNLITRLRTAYPQLKEISQNAFKDLPDVVIEDEDYNFMEDEATSKLSDALQGADAKMRSLLDYNFDSNVSELCAPHGSMFDPINGKLRFEHIIDTLTPLYETDISTEMNKVTANVSKHTAKYTK